MSEPTSPDRTRIIKRAKTCDISDCNAPAVMLLGEFGGSVLSVCHQCGEYLTAEHSACDDARVDRFLMGISLLIMLLGVVVGWQREPGTTDLPTVLGALLFGLGTTGVGFAFKED